MKTYSSMDIILPSLANDTSRIRNGVVKKALMYELDIHKKRKDR